MELWQPKVSFSYAALRSLRDQALRKHLHEGWLVARCDLAIGSSGASARFERFAAARPSGEELVENEIAARCLIRFLDDWRPADPAAVRPLGDEIKFVVRERDSRLQGVGPVAAGELLAWLVVVAVDPHECRAELQVRAYYPSLTFSVQLLATPLRTAQTPLLQELVALGRKAPLGFGFLTLDMSRQVVCMLERDGLVASVPLVGAWVDLALAESAAEALPVAWWDAARVAEHPSVCAVACRFVHSARIKERVLVDDRTFLMMLIHPAGLQSDGALAPCVSFFELTYSEVADGRVLVAPAGHAWAFDVDAVQSCVGTEVWELPPQLTAQGHLDAAEWHRAENPEEDVPAAESTRRAPAHAKTTSAFSPPQARPRRAADAGLAETAGGLSPPAPRSRPAAEAALAAASAATDLVLSGMELPRAAPPRPHNGPDGAVATEVGGTPMRPLGGRPWRYTEGGEGSARSSKQSDRTADSDQRTTASLGDFRGAAKEWIRKLDLEMTGSVLGGEVRGGPAAAVADAPWPGHGRGGTAGGASAGELVAAEHLAAGWHDTPQPDRRLAPGRRWAARTPVRAAGVTTEYIEIAKAQAIAEGLEPQDSAKAASLRHLVAAQHEQLFLLQQQVTQLQSMVMTLAQPPRQTVGVAPLSRLGAPIAAAPPPCRRDAAVGVGDSLSLEPRQRDVGVSVGASIDFSTARREAGESEHTNAQFVVVPVSETCRTASGGHCCTADFSGPELPAVLPVTRTIGAAGSSSSVLAVRTSGGLSASAGSWQAPPRGGALCAASGRGPPDLVRTSGDSWSRAAPNLQMQVTASSEPVQQAAAPVTKEGLPEIAVATAGPSAKPDVEITSELLQEAAAAGSTKVKEWLALGCTWSSPPFGDGRSSSSTGSASAPPRLEAPLTGAAGGLAQRASGGLRDSADTAGGASPRPSQPGAAGAGAGPPAADGACTAVPRAAWHVGLSVGGLGAAASAGAVLGTTDGVPRIVWPPSMSSLGSMSSEASDGGR